MLDTHSVTGWITLHNNESIKRVKAADSPNRWKCALLCYTFDIKSPTQELEYLCVIHLCVTLRAAAGFDAQWDTVPVNAVGIHHPHGNAKKISFANGS